MNLKAKLCIVLLCLSFTAFSQRVGLYASADDFKRGKLTDVGQFISATMGVHGKVKFEKATVTPGSDNPYWGFRGIRNNKEEDFRFGSGHEYYHLANHGPIYIYNAFQGTPTVITYNQDSSAVTQLEFYFGDVYLSKDADGELLYFSLKTVKQVLSDDAELLAAYKNDKTKYVSKGDNDLMKAFEYITFYNTKHKKK